MSGFTTTPNYALFKPTPGLDNDAWGDHLNANADTLDTLIKTFLPLSGGTVTGNLTVSGNTTFAAVTASGRITSAGLTSTASIVGQTGITAGTNTATTGGTFLANALAGNQRYIQFMSAGSNRMRFGVDNVAESVGTNVGSNPFLNVYDDAGGTATTAWSYNRVSQQNYMPSLRLGKAPAFTYTGQAPDATFGPFNMSFGFAGATSKVPGQWPAFITIAIPSDSLDVGAGNQRFGMNGIQRYGNAGFTGSATGFSWSLAQNAAIPNADTYQAGRFAASAQFGGGGTNLWEGSNGRVFGLALYSTLYAGAANYQACSGMEIDVTVEAGASCRAIDGLHVVRLDTHAFSPPIWEADVGIAVITAAQQNNAKYGFAIGGINGYWPVDQTSGRLIGTPFTNMFAGTNLMQSAHGVDFNPVNLTGTFVRGRGFSVLGSARGLPAGTVQVGNVYLSDNGTTASLDVAGRTCTAAAIASGGANMVVGIALIDDTTGTLAFVTAVTGGVATAIALVPNTGFTITPPANPVTMRVSTWSPGSFATPTAPTLNLTWTATTNGLAIQPTAGGKLGFYGATPIVKQTGVAVTLAAVHAALVNLGLIAP